MTECMVARDSIHIEREGGKSECMRGTISRSSLSKYGSNSRQVSNYTQKTAEKGEQGDGELSSSPDRNRPRPRGSHPSQVP